ncbi:MAG: virulence protein RhuM/Fic/DOC family protein [Deltaproteobacteria bacterium]|nr:virulence protein RhuM/Fic/DOC family protein [Deltaproteobacteria bacterium]
MQNEERRPEVKKSILHSTFDIRHSPSAGGEVILYEAADGGPAVEVRVRGDTLWLDAHQMAALFERDRTVIVRHIRNIYGTGELDREATCAKNAQVAADKKVRQMDLYNLDMAISVGYRVNSKRGTQFRIWATRVLRDHLVKGYTVNDRRLKELQQAARLVADVAERRELSGEEAAAVLRVVADYAYALDVLDDYDHQRIQLREVTAGPTAALTVAEARRVVERLRERFGGSSLFGKEKDAGLEGSLAAVVQTFGGTDVYPSLEEKAANLLYFLTKNHHFVDGNKRIAAALFLWFLEKNAALYRPDGTKRIADNALVAMTLLIAESRPEVKEVLARVVVNLINKMNG